MDDLDIACWMADSFIAADQASWANFREVGLYELTAHAIRATFRLGVLHDSDLWSVDQSLWELLVSSTDPGVQAILRNVSPETQFVWDDARVGFLGGHQVTDHRPGWLLNGELRLLSALDEDFAKRRVNYLASKGGK